jgi:hypothetical protein
MRLRPLHLHRWLFNLGAAVSLPLCVAAAVLWVRSYGDHWFDYQFTLRGDQNQWLLRAVEGRFTLNWVDPTPWFFTPSNGGERVTRYTAYEVFGFPLWMGIATTTFLPAVWTTRWKRLRRRRSVDLCPSCGYDVRATPDRCPECGAVVRRLAKTAAQPANAEDRAGG